MLTEGNPDSVNRDARVASREGYCARWKRVGAVPKRLPRACRAASRASAATRLSCAPASCRPASSARCACCSARVGGARKRLRSAREWMTWRRRPVHALLRLLDRAPSPSPERCHGRSTTPAPQSKRVPQTSRLVAHDAPLVAIGSGLRVPAAGPARFILLRTRARHPAPRSPLWTHWSCTPIYAARRRQRLEALRPALTPVQAARRTTVPRAAGSASDLPNEPSAPRRESRWQQEP